MSRAPASRPSKRRSALLLPCLLVGLALPAAAGAADASAAAASASQPARLPAAYRVVNLGPGDVTGVQINDSGQVAYALSSTGPTRNFFYDGSRITEIAVPGTVPAVTISLNNAGQVVGTSFDRSSRLAQS